MHVTSNVSARGMYDLLNRLGRTRMYNISFDYFGGLVSDVTVQSKRTGEVVLAAVGHFDSIVIRECIWHVHYHPAHIRRDDLV